VGDRPRTVDVREILNATFYIQPIEDFCNTTRCAADYVEGVLKAIDQTINDQHSITAHRARILVRVHSELREEGCRCGNQPPSPAQDGQPS